MNLVHLKLCVYIQNLYQYKQENILCTNEHGIRTMTKLSP